MKMKTKNIFLMSFIVFVLVGCGSSQYKTGDSFFRDIDASGKNPTYYKEGTYQGSDFFVVNPYWQKYEKQAGLLVRGDKVVQPLTQEDVSKIRTAQSQRNAVSSETEPLNVNNIDVKLLEKKNQINVLMDTRRGIQNQYSRAQDSGSTSEMINISGILKKNTNELNSLEEEIKVLQQKKDLIQKNIQSQLKAENEVLEQKRIEKEFGSSGVVIKLNYVGENQECIQKSGWTCRTYLETGEVLVNALVRNNTINRVKDIKINCQNIAKSGTVLNGGFGYKTSTVIFDMWNPKEIKNISFKISDIQQRNSTNCKVVDWVNLK